MSFRRECCDEGDFRRASDYERQLANLSTAGEADMSFAEYSNYDGLALAELVKKKKVQPSELVEAAALAAASEAIFWGKA
jgi:hypothetical protein